MNKQSTATAKSQSAPTYCYVILITLTVVLCTYFFALAAHYRTYTIVDGREELTVSSESEDPITVLDEAGVTLSANDSYTVTGNEHYAKITVERNAIQESDAAVSDVPVSPDGSDSAVKTSAESSASSDANVLMENDSVIPAPVYESDSAVDTSAFVEEAEDTAAAPITAVDSPSAEPDVLKQADEALAVLAEDNDEVTANIPSSEPVTDASDPTSTNEPAVAESAESVDVTTDSTAENVIITSNGTALTYSYSLSVIATAYTGGGTTATGTPARYGEIAVDPSVIPYGTKMYIVSDDGNWIYGVATAEDTGGAITGNRIDLYYDDYDTCIQFGRRSCTVYILN